MSITGEPSIFQTMEAECREAVATINRLTADLKKATATINEQTTLIEHLSKDNLALVAKLDALTGKTAPGTGFSA